MLLHRKSTDRGHFDFGWLNTYHTFSFGDYHDPKHMGFSVLRVINEDFVAPGEGFPMHGHRDMEIITYVISGALAHKDTLGNSTTIKPGEVQRMTAGTGIKHSEFNALNDKPTHLLQIWILPEKPSLQPGYEQKEFTKDFENEKFKLVASQNGTEGSISAHQDFKLFAGHFNAADSQKVELKAGRNAWVQLIEGRLQINDITLSAGDGLAVSKESTLNLKALDKSHFLFFDLP